MNYFPEMLDDEPRGPAARMPQRQASGGRRRKKKPGLSQKQMMWGGIVLGVLLLGVIGSAIDDKPKSIDKPKPSTSDVFEVRKKYDELEAREATLKASLSALEEHVKNGYGSQSDRRLHTRGTRRLKEIRERMAKLDRRLVEMREQLMED